MGRRNKRNTVGENPKEPWKIIAAVAATGRLLLEVYRTLRDGLADQIREVLRNLFNG
ncbi:hypothetical protein [Streptosporangium saharense]|uniref:hypothetical protein n=1 Tax=Streptosporangium saharense TaxID=1706840 RepID=UPI0036A5BA1E